MTRGLILLLIVFPALHARSLWAQPVPIRLTVVDAVARAFETSHRLAEARARQAGAEATVRVRQTADRPTALASAGYSRTNHVEEFGIPQPDSSFRLLYPDIPDNVVTRFGVQWPIYTAGRADALERSAAAEASAIRLDIDATRGD